MNANANEVRTRQAMKLIAWLERFHPEMYRAVVERVGEAPPNGGLNNLGHYWWQTGAEQYGLGHYWWKGSVEQYGLGQLGQDGYVPPGAVTAPAPADVPWWQEAIDAVSGAAQAYLQYDAQKDLIELQKARVMQGQEPIDPGVVAPTIRHQVDLPPQVAQEINRMKMGAGNLLMWAAIGLGAFLLVRAL